MFGFTHASSVIPVVRSSDAASATVTHALVPLNESAEPNLPDAVHVALEIVPVLPCPDASVTWTPLPVFKRDPPAALASSLFDILGEWSLAVQSSSPSSLLDRHGSMLILKAISLGPLHGYGVLLRIQQISREKLQIQQGSLYPALYRLEHQGLITSEWGESENRRKAKYFTLTATGRNRLREEVSYWERLSDAINVALKAVPEDV